MSVIETILIDGPTNHVPKPELRDYLAEREVRHVMSLGDFQNDDDSFVLPDGGVADQGSGIQAAIYAAGAAGATTAILAVPGGTFGFTEPVAGFGLYSNVSANIVGAGKGKTIFKNLSATGWGFRFNASYAHLSDITLDQNGSTGRGISVGGQYSSLQRVEVKNQGGTNYAIELDGCSFSMIEDIQIHTSTYGIRCGATTPLNHLTCNHVLIETNAGTALDINTCTSLVFTKLEIEPANAATNIKKQIYAFNSRRLDFVGFGYEDSSTNVQDDAAYFEFQNCTGVSFKGGGITHAGSASKSVFLLSSSAANFNKTWTAENIHITSTKTGMTLFDLATVSHYGVAVRDIVTTLTSTAVGVSCGSAQQGLIIENWKDINVTATFALDAVDLHVMNVTGDIALTTRARQVLTNCAGVISGTGLATADITPSPSELVTANAALSVRGTSRLDTTGGAKAHTLADGGVIGDIKIIPMTVDGGDAVLTIANHETSSPEVATFAEAGDTLTLMWSGSVWMTLHNRGVVF